MNNLAVRLAVASLAAMAAMVAVAACAASPCHTYDASSQSLKKLVSDSPAAVLKLLSPCSVCSSKMLTLPPERRAHLPATQRWAYDAAERAFVEAVRRLVVHTTPSVSVQVVQEGWQLVLVQVRDGVVQQYTGEPGSYPREITKGRHSSAVEGRVLHCGNVWLQEGRDSVILAIPIRDKAGRTGEVQMIIPRVRTEK